MPATARAALAPSRSWSKSMSLTGEGSSLEYLSIKHAGGSGTVGRSVGPSQCLRVVWMALVPWWQGNLHSTGRCTVDMEPWRSTVSRRQTAQQLVHPARVCRLSIRRRRSVKKKAEAKRTQRRRLRAHVRNRHWLACGRTSASRRRADGDGDGDAA